MAQGLWYNLIKLNEAPSALTSKVIPDKIRIARKAVKLTQMELGKAIGMSDKAISGYESARVIPPIDKLEKLAEATNHPLGFFIGEDENNYDVFAAIMRMEKELQEIGKNLQSSNPKTTKFPELI